MGESSQVDEQYYQVVPSGSIAERVMVAARDRIYSDFSRLLNPTSHEHLIDVGVSDVVTAGANMLEQRHPYPERITAVGLGDGREFKRVYPLVTYRKIKPHVPLPFDDGTFDIACSNAVVEHLSEVRYQRAFINDLCRVARRVFIVIPNRFFPIEHHTALPLAGWSDLTFRAGCRLTGKSEWADPANLILMSRRRLASLCPPGRRAEIGYTGIKLGAFSSNLYMAIHQG